MSRTKRKNTLTTACEVLIRHYRACDLTDGAIARLTGLHIDVVKTVVGASLLSPKEVEEVRSRPGVP